jgi:hypothetical protein
VLPIEITSRVLVPVELPSVRVAVAEILPPIA